MRTEAYIFYIYDYNINMNKSRKLKLRSYQFFNNEWSEIDNYLKQS